MALRVNYNKFGHQSFAYRRIVFKGWTIGELETAWEIATHGIDNATTDPHCAEFVINAVVQGHVLDVVCAAILYKSSCVPIIKRVRGERDRWIITATRELQASYVKREPVFNHYKV